MSSDAHILPTPPLCSSSMRYVMSNTRWYHARLASTSVTVSAMWPMDGCARVIAVPPVSSSNGFGQGLFEPAGVGVGEIVERSGTVADERWSVHQGERPRREVGEHADRGCGGGR